MSTHDFPLTQEEFETIYAKVPRLTVEILLKNKEGAIFLSKRAIEPCKGKWHLPGGTVRFGETLQKTVERIAKRELGISVLHSKNVGHIDYPSHFLHGLDSPVGIVFEVLNFSGLVTINNEASSYNWFTELPVDIHEDQDVWLVENGYLSQNS